MGIASEASELRYFQFSDPLYNTFDENRKNELESQGMMVVAEKNIPVAPLAQVLEKHLHQHSIDFLNVDVEMLDLEVLKTLDWQKTCSQVVAVEDHDMDLENHQASEIHKFLSGKGYALNSQCHFTSVYKIKV